MSHSCSWSFVGPLPLDDARRLSIGCMRPNLLRCKVDKCGRELVVKCGTTRSAACEPCGLEHRGRVGIVAGSGMRHRVVRRSRQVVSTDGLFVTLTAPGVRQHRIGRKGGGWGPVCSCTPVGGVNLAEWNGSAGKRWNEFCKAVRRTYGADVEFFKGTEVQRRGALHFHAIFKRREGGVLAMTDASVRRLALQYGFGHEVKVVRFEPGHAAYVAKYVSKSANDRQRAPWSGRKFIVRQVETLDGRRVEMRLSVDTGSPTYRTWSASRKFGDPMRLVRAAQQHFRSCVAALPPWDEPQPLAGYIEVRPEFAALVCVRPDRVGPPVAPEHD